MISIIIPVLNEAAGISAALQGLQPLRQAGHEIIVADGGSQDGTAALAAPLCDQLIHAPRGRARQMNAGAAAASGAVLLFLHADTCLPPGADELINAALADSKRRWGRFDLRLSGTHPALRLIETMMNLRSRLSGIATGDQCLFAARDLFERVGGFPDIALMEDIALSRTLKQHGRPLCLRARVVSSSRRWETRGILRTILLMWRLRLAYFFGADPQSLARDYDKNGRTP